MGLETESDLGEVTSPNLPITAETELENTLETDPPPVEGKVETATDNFSEQGLQQGLRDILDLLNTNQKASSYIVGGGLVLSLAGNAVDMPFVGLIGLFVAAFGAGRLTMGNISKSAIEEVLGNSEDTSE